MAGSISLKNRGPSPFEFTHKGKSVAIPSGGVAGPFDSTVLRNDDVYDGLTHGRLISFGDAGPTAEMAKDLPTSDEVLNVPDQRPKSVVSLGGGKKKKHKND